MEAMFFRQLDLTESPPLFVDVRNEFATRNFERLTRARPGHARLWHCSAEKKPSFDPWLAIFWFRTRPKSAI